MLTRMTVFVVSILFLPVVGTALAGHSLSFRFHYPPVSRHALFTDFSSPVFSFYAAVLVAATALLFGAVCCRGSARTRPAPAERRHLPWWTWVGLATLAVGAGAGFVGHPAAAIALLLTGFAVAVDGLNYRRGATLIGQRPGYFFSLFALGAALWWLLEYLNRFAPVWYFTPHSAGSTPAYLLFGTLAFAPVPAVVMTLQVWLNSLPAMERLRHGRPLPAAGAQASALWLILLSAVGLMAGAVWPALVGLFWSAPVLLLSALQLLWNRETFFAGIFRGSWGRLVASAAAGVMAGTLIAAANTLFDGGWHMAPPLLQCCELLGVPLLGYGGFALLGILSMQLSDRLAGVFPGRARPAPGKRKPFPIPVRSE